ncbi:MAG: ASCH domain-containing protein [Ruminococcus sp.]|nr:ASCH domain-containing protein [Ruminococcus sp.]MCM1480749.1 ASCH domain-containing protein [Muribaculaceae bacterium]
MKALSVRNPWAQLIFEGEKTFEYRTWKTDYRGDLLICSTANPKIKDTICGHAICVVRLNDIVKVTKENYQEFENDLTSDDIGIYAWQLTDLRYIQPFPIKGKQGFANVDDSLITIVCNADDELTDEEGENFVKTCIEPYLYKGN